MAPIMKFDFETKKFIVDPDQTKKLITDLDTDFVSGQQKDVDNDDKRYHVRLNRNFFCGFLFPINNVKNSIETICWQNGVECKFIQNRIGLTKYLTILLDINNRTTKEIREFEEKIDDYFRRLHHQYYSRL